MFNNELWQKPAGGAAGGNFYTHQIANSVRVPATSSTSSSNGRLTKTFSTVDSSVHWTLNFWIKRSAIEGTNPVTSARPLTWFTPRNGTSGSVLQEFKFCSPTAGGTAGDSLMIVNTNSNNIVLSTDNLFRDTSAWYNIHIQADLDNGTNSERLKYFINGTEASYNTDNRGSYTSLPGITAGAWTIGDYHNYGYPIQCYFAQWAYVDGYTHPPTDFGESKNGVWIPKDLSSGITWGSAGHLLDFASSSDLGNDVSGNNNDWAVANIAAHDQMLDSPTFGSEGSANFPAFSPLYYTQSTNITEGNLDFVSTGNIEGGLTNAVIPAGEATVYYFEWCVTVSGGGHEVYIGVNGLNIDMSGSSERGGRDEATCWGFLTQPSGYQYVQAGSFDGRSEVSLTISTGDVVGMVIDRANTTIKWYINNSLKVTSTNLIATGDLAVWSGKGGGTTNVGGILNAGQDSSFAGQKTAGGNADSNGFGDFFYAPPTGTVAYCTGNLSAAGADPAQEKQPVNNYFQAVTYTGTGANGRSLTTKLKPVNFIGKNRTTGTSTPTRWWATTGNNFGTGTELYVQLDTNSYGYSSSTYQGVSNPQDTSITIGNVGYINVGSSSYVAYLHGVAGASAVTDTSGDIDSVRFTDADAGISIMDYTGSGTNGHTVPHGLGVKPSFVIIKNSTITGNSAAWRVWSDAYGDYNDYGVLNTSAAWQTSSGIFTADPTTTMLPLASGDTQNSSSNTYIAWVFANTEGMVKAGTYVGNGNADGSFVYTGFKPAWVMVKNTSATEAWVVADNGRSPFNVVDEILKPNNNNPEATGSTYYCDFLSNGFKPRTTWEGWNQTNTFVYLAFAEMPFKYATAR